MKTITEFAGTVLKAALKTRQDLLASGKTPEELPAAMGEALKLEGDKLTLILNAVDVVEKKTNDLKRVVVWSLQEGEKAPRGTEQKGEHYFAIEFFPPLPGQEKPGRHKHGRGDKRDDRKGGKKRGRGPRRDDRDRGRGGDRVQAAGAPGAVGEGPKPSEGGEGGRNDPRKRRRRGPPRGPRPEGAAAAAPRPQATGERLPPIKPRVIDAGAGTTPPAPASTATPSAATESEPK